VLIDANAGRKPWVATCGAKIVGNDCFRGRAKADPKVLRPGLLVRQDRANSLLMLQPAMTDQSG
jgi:hypothetical protein